MPSGEPVRLSEAECSVIYAAFYGELTEPVGDRLGACLALYVLAGPEARMLFATGTAPPLSTNFFTVWASAGPELRPYLRRVGTSITCPALGTTWSAAA